MSVNESAAEEIRALVLARVVRPGERLPELTLAGRLGVSRPTVREALRRLESRGLLTSDDGRGLCVVHADERELAGVILTRASLEGLHAELVAQRVKRGELSPAQLRHLEGMIRGGTRRAAAGQGVTPGDRALHQTIDTLADNPVGAEVLDRLWDQLVVAGERVRPTAEPAAARDEHRAIVAAITAGKPRRAREAATAHARSLLDGLRLR